MLNRYKIFGYHVLSEIEIDAYHDDFEQVADVEILLGAVTIDDTLKTGGFSFSHHGPKIQMNVPEVGAFEILEGNKIIVEVYEGAKDSAVQLYLLGSSFGFLMHQRKEFPLHGSAIALDGDSSVILVGHSGAGKSSLASGFIDEGFKILTDDVARVTESQDGFEVHPSYPSQKIWKDAVTQLAIAYEDQNRILNRLDKFYVNDRERFCQASRRLNAIIEIEPGDVDRPKWIKLNSQERLNALITHSYRQEFMGKHTDLRAHLRWCSKLINQVPVYRIYRPKEGFTVKAQVYEILEAIGLNKNI